LEGMTEVCCVGEIQILGDVLRELSLPEQILSVTDSQFGQPRRRRFSESVFKAPFEVTE